MLKAMGKGSSLAKKNVIAITDERRTPSTVENGKDFKELQNLKQKESLV